MHAGDASLTPRSGQSLEDLNGNPFQYSCLGNPMDRGAWQATVRGSQELATTWQLNNPKALKLTDNSGEAFLNFFEVLHTFVYLTTEKLLHGPMFWRTAISRSNNIHNWWVIHKL